MGKRKKIISIIIIFIIAIIIPIFPSHCNNLGNKFFSEKNNYLAHCLKKNNKDLEKYGIIEDNPIPPGNCEEHHNEINPVIGFNFKIYKNSCQACKDCQKNFLSNILRIILNIVK